MVFNSYSFLFLFFPIFFILYRKVPLRWCLPLLCAGSLVFYAVGVWDRLWQLLLLLGMALFGFLGCLLFRREKLRKKWLLALWLCVTAAPLAYVKLAGLFLPQAPGLPLGLSFYTFQQIALLVFAWQGGFVTAEEYAAGVLMFPKLISGPLAEPEELLDELDDPRRSLGRLAEGLEDFILGLACKVIVADHLAGILGPIRVRGVLNVSVPLAWLGVLGYALRLYFDFWGYSLMAAGIGMMLGFHFVVNFIHPYWAVGIADFYRRWHTTLGSWFRDYVYIPLGGSRKGILKTIRNLFVVWLLTGLWHGITWNYLIWAGVLVILIIWEKFVAGGLMERLPIIGHLHVWLFIPLTWVIFAIPDLRDLQIYFMRLFPFFESGLNVNYADYMKYFLLYWPYLVVGLLLCTPFWYRLIVQNRRKLPVMIIMTAVFWISVYRIVIAASNPFMYFSF